MSFKFSVISTVFLFIFQFAFGQEPPIIPLPNTYDKAAETFLLNKHTAIIVKDSAYSREANYLRNKILDYTQVSVSDKSNRHNRIILSTPSPKKKSFSKKGSYHIEMKADQIEITARDDSGMFYGIISLLQLIAKAEPAENSLPITCWNIQDAPLYQWRGFMLDESRHFFGKEVVKEILEEMAWLKLNKFHWHLTDVPGWRLEIQKYPLLNLIGGIGNYSDKNAPAQYYTQDEIREIVAFAEKRHIEIIPEIDMPGHATAANSAYPEFSGGGSEKFPDFTFNPGKEETYSYLTDILREVSVLFPSKNIHLGGDEVSFGIEGWNQNTGVQELMKKENLDSLKAVENYFFNRMIDSSLTIFNKILAWDEAVDAEIPTNHTIIYWWRHKMPQQLNKALDKGYQVIMSPRIPLYFDFVQDSSHLQGRKWAGNYSSLKGVYHFNETNYLENTQKSDHIAGIQANLWTEQIKTQKRLEFMIFPRITALAESGWTTPKNKNYPQFLLRLAQQLALYDQKDIYYYNPINPEKTPEIIDKNID